MDTLRTRIIFAIALLIACFLNTATLFADPLPGRDILKFSQRPMDNTEISVPAPWAATGATTS
jgi:hypothetical protein